MNTPYNRKRLQEALGQDADRFIVASNDLLNTYSASEIQDVFSTIIGEYIEPFSNFSGWGANYKEKIGDVTKKVCNLLNAVNWRTIYTLDADDDTPIGFLIQAITDFYQIDESSKLINHIITGYSCFLSGENRPKTTNSEIKLLHSYYAQIMAFIMVLSDAERLLFEQFGNQESS